MPFLFAVAARAEADLSRVLFAGARKIRTIVAADAADLVAAEAPLREEDALGRDQLRRGHARVKKHLQQRAILFGNATEGSLPRRLLARVRLPHVFVVPGEVVSC